MTDAPPERPASVALGVIPWRFRLGTRIFLATLAAAGAILWGLAATDVAVTRKLEEHASRSNSLLAAALQASMREGMLRGGPGHAYDALSQEGQVAGVLRLRVFDKRGRIVHSSDRAEEGSTVPRQAQPCRQCHAGESPLSWIPILANDHVEWIGGERALATVSPIYNDRTCATAECHAHPQGRSVLGLLEVGVSLAPLDRDVADFRYRTLLVSAVMVVFFAWLLWVGARAEVLAPVAALVEGTRRVARHQLNVEISIDHHGEMGLLAASFNDMTRALSEAEGKLRLLNADLERQVSERTADLRAAQDQVLRAEKLSSLGKLSASIAHEINNPLAGILTFAKLVTRKLSDGELSTPADREKALRSLALIEREAHRCSVIVKNLLDFARERPLLVKPADVNQAVDEILTLVDHMAEIQGVEIVRERGALPPVLGDFGQLRQAFMNIASNACEAMQGGGRLTVTTRAVAGEPGVEVVFQDTGPGIPADRIGRVFDPFFTTKERGTGLGLSVVYGIVQKHGGQIEVQSEEGKGTRFTLRFRAATPEELGEPPGA